MTKSYYLTTPIYYVNDKPHIGHAYTTLACDALARFKRLDGYDVMFLTGTDEHGQKVQKSAEEKGIDPKTFTDQVSQNFRDLTIIMDFKNTDFIRTTEPRHYKACQKLWQKLMENGDIYLGSYAGWYAVRDEAFYNEDEIKDGKAPSGASVEWLEEPSYFFKLSSFQDRLLDHYDKHLEFVAPKSRFNEVKSFVKGGLHDLSVSRASFDWGVPVPNDGGANDDKHVMYVWLDALTNYLTAAGYGAGAVGEENFSHRWPADLHMVGKDILRFHAVYWPAFLMAADLPLPKRIYAHGWWTNEGQKISKSLGNVIDPIEIAEKYGLDQMRYFMLREVPFGNDGDFSHASMVHRINGDLANDLGNLSQRVLSMVHKNCDGIMPDLLGRPLTADDDAILALLDGLLERQRGHYDAQSFHEAIKDIWDVVAAANRYVDATAPWALAKTDRDRMEVVLWVMAQTLHQVAILIQPITPKAAAEMLNQLGIAEDARGFEQLRAGHRLAGGWKIEKPTPIFPRFILNDDGADGEEGA